jgi:hypothetical protein
MTIRVPQSQQHFPDFIPYDSFILLKTSDIEN